MEDKTHKSIPINFNAENFSIFIAKLTITANTGLIPTIRLTVTADPRSKEVYTNTAPNVQPTKPARIKYFTDDFLEKDDFKSAILFPAKNRAKILIKPKQKIFAAE